MIAFVVWLAVPGTFAHAQVHPSNLDYHHLRSQVAIGLKHMCAITRGKVRCWQDARDPEIQKLIEMPLAVSSPLQIAAGDKHTCVLDSEDVRCNHVYKTWTQPKLKHVREIAAMENSVCALDKEGVKCWGENESSQKYIIPNLKKPRLLTAGGYQVSGHPPIVTFCAVDGEALYCQGSLASGKVNLDRPLKNARYVSVGAQRVCVIDDVGVACSIKSEPDLNFSQSDNLQQFEAAFDPCLLQNGKVQCGIKSNKFPYASPLPIRPLFIVPGRTKNMCAVAEDFEMFCWGITNTNVPWRIPPNFIKMAVTASALCTLSPGSVRCFGNDQDGGLQVPELKNPYDISASPAGVCVLDDEGLKCWRDKSTAEVTVQLADLKVPHPKNDRFKQVAIGELYVYLATELKHLYAYAPTGRNLMNFGAPFGGPHEKLTTGTNKVCTLRDSQVWCAGSNFFGAKNIMELNDLVDVRVQGNVLCAKRKSSEVQCASQENLPNVGLTFSPVDATKTPFPFEQVFELSAACQMSHSSTGRLLKCDSQDMTVWPKFRDPVVAANDHTSFCIWDRVDKNMMCRGLSYIPWEDGSVHKKINGNRFFTLEKLPAHLRVIAHYSLPARRMFLEELAAFADRLSESKSSRWRMLRFLEPLVKTEDAPFFVEEIEPAYSQAMEHLRFQLEGEFEAHSQEQLVVALRVMAAALKTMGEFLAPADRAAIVVALRDLSRATVRPDAEAVKSALKSAAAVDTAKFTSPQTEFLVQSLHMATEWLKAEMSL